VVGTALPKEEALTKINAIRNLARVAVIGCSGIKHSIKVRAVYLLSGKRLSCNSSFGKANMTFAFEKN